jgi:catalase
MKQRIRGSKFQEHYNQPQLFFNSLTAYEKKHLIDAISFELDHCDDPVVYQTYTNVLNCIDFEMAKNVARNVGSTIPDKPGRENHGKTSKSLSQRYYEPKVPTIVERRIAILVEDGFDLEEVTAVRNALTSAKARTFIIGPRRGKVYPSGEHADAKKGIKADHHFEGQRSTLFDALYIPSGGQHIDALAKNGRVVQYVREAFGHCKAIGAVGYAVEFLREVVNLPGVEFQHGDSANVTSSYGVITTGKVKPKSVATDELEIKPGSKDFTVEFAYATSRHRWYEREMDGLTSRVAY